MSESTPNFDEVIIRAGSSELHIADGFSEVGEFLAAPPNQGEGAVSLTKLLTPGLHGDIVMAQTVEYLALNTAERSGKSPLGDRIRAGLTTRRGRLGSILVDGYFDEPSLLLGSVFWLDVYSSLETPARLMLLAKKNSHLSEDQIVEQLVLAEWAAQQLVDGVLDSNPIPPYSLSAFMRRWHGQRE
jgi:hypothetical protein